MVTSTRLGVISDIHGNLVALDAVLEDLRRLEIERIVCLGDVAQGGPDPAGCVDRVRQLGTPVVMGNADDWLLTGELQRGSGEDVSEKQAALRVWALDQFDAELLTFMESFVPQTRMEVGEQALLCFHGSPKSFDDILFPDTPQDEADAMLGESGVEFLAGGHTHLQWVARGPDYLFFNPGSVGFAFDRFAGDEFIPRPWAEYGIVHESFGRISIEMRSIPFDIARLIESIGDSDMPDKESQEREWRAASAPYAGV